MPDLQSGTFSFQPVNEWPYNANFQDFATFLGLPAEKDAKGLRWNHDQKTAKRIEEIYKYGIVKSGKFDHEAVKKQIYSLIRKVGVNWTGELLVNQLWQHLQLESDYLGKLGKMMEKKTQARNVGKDYLEMDLADEALKKPEKSKIGRTKQVEYKREKPETYDSDIEIENIRGKKPKTEFLEM